ncbi:MAG: LysR family transcriptional regulator [Gammaproteobacteria bacterium]
MDLELLRTFLEVNRTRHFGRAAEALHLTQAAVSARIKHLEGILNTSLFDRAGRDIRLTPEGNRLKRHADLLLAEWRKARQEVTAGGAKFQMSIGGSPRLWDVILQDWLIALRKQHSELALITHSLSPEPLLRGVLDGVIDLAIMLDPPILETLDAREVATLRLVLVSDRAGISIDEAINETFLLVDWGLAHALELQRTYPDMPEPITRLANARLASRYLREIGGSAYLPLPSVISAISRGRLHRVQGAAMFERSVYAVYPVRSNKEDLIRNSLQLFPRAGRQRRDRRKSAEPDSE